MKGRSERRSQAMRVLGIRLDKETDSNAGFRRQARRKKKLYKFGRVGEWRRERNWIDDKY